MAKLISLNVEQDKHLDLVIPFIEQEKAEIVALMEVYEEDVAKILHDYPYHTFAPNCRSTDGRNWGVAVGSKSELTKENHFYGDGIEGEEIPPHGRGTHRPLLVVAETEGIKIGALHWTWTEGGLVTEKQSADFERLINYLRGEEIVLCGDFNLPRNLPGGNEIYERLTKIYKDNIPPEFISTVDPHIHRANKDNPGKLAWMVDYVWTTPRYKVSGVKVVSGVSDHCGVVCSIF